MEFSRELISEEQYSVVQLLMPRVHDFSDTELTPKFMVSERVCDTTLVWESHSDTIKLGVN